MWSMRDNGLYCVRTCHARQAAVRYIAQSEIDYTIDAAEGDCGFRPVLHQNVQPAADASGKKERHNVPHFIISPLLYSFLVKRPASTLG